MSRHPSLPSQMPSDDPLPRFINGYFSLRGARTVFKGTNSTRSVVHESTKAFQARPVDSKSVRRSLEKEGFLIIAESPLGIAVCGPPEAFAAITGGRVVPFERADSSGKQPDALRHRPGCRRQRAAGRARRRVAEILHLESRWHRARAAQNSDGGQSVSNSSEFAAPTSAPAR